MPHARIDTRRSGSLIVGVRVGERHHGRVDELLAGVLEVHRHAMAVDRLNLPDAPIRAVGMGDEVPRSKSCSAA